MFVGEAPGFHEDQQGVPFVGQAGKLLDQLLGGIGLTRADVYVANVLKCRPPGNRDPLPDEIAGLRAAPLPPDRADRAEGRRDARQLRDEAALRQADRDHARARQRAGGDARRPRGAALPALPPGGRALHAGDAEGARGGLRADPGAARAASVEPAPVERRAAAPSRARARVASSSACSDRAHRARQRLAGGDRGDRGAARRASSRRATSSPSRASSAPARRPSSAARAARSASTAPVTSPTFTIGHRYTGRVDVSHLDLYRFAGVSRGGVGRPRAVLRRRGRASSSGPRRARRASAAARRVSLAHVGGDRRRSSSSGETRCSRHRAMLILAFDTATDVATSALVADGDVLGERTSRARRALLADVDALLAGAGAQPARPRRARRRHGPGSFTGMRIGLAVARGARARARRPGRRRLDARRARRRRARARSR